MNNNSKYILKTTILILTSLLISCETFIDVDVTDREKRLVVHSLFNPGEPFTARISHSLATFSNEEYQELTNALVVISSENSSDTLSYYDGLYLSNNFPEPGIRYSIEVNNEEYQSVNANDVIPDEIIVVDLTSDSGFHNGQITREFELTLKNKAGIKEYIIIELLILETWDYGKGDYYPTNISTEDPVVENINDIEYGAQKLLFTDQSFDGQEYKLRFFIPYYYSENASFKVRTYSCSESYYKYIKTIDKYHETNGDFFSQPVQIYSNVENGIGIFGGYRINETELIIIR